ncbi:site-2 protease family protein [Candidatus Nitrosacidococcus sp. I8]|uniref:site-2 protease family protein n=1 Tax=Candidatus Nitrosacidococcus sp. I8 TaxID=2942908 RepID=UPI0022275300|nr:site-2 protease family protein [Candidatus Nitrosacidococcus sp. I8]CAH9018772.1 Putative zinc metalloprotease Rip3 [Candidatus Nitrosacidococcus sp. I8]
MKIKLLPRIYCGQIAYIKIYLDWSLAIMFFLITLGMATSVFPSWHPDWHTWIIWILSALAALFFISSILIHELSHALIGRRKGIEVKNITLFVFGGVAQLEHEPHTWQAELWMALAGPIASIILGVIILIISILTMDLDYIKAVDSAHVLESLSPATSLLFWLGPINIFLGLFNLIPGFPMDGGRVFRAVLWAMTHDIRQATFWAYRVGQVCAGLFIMIGIATILDFPIIPFLGTGLIGGLWFIFIGWFLYRSAQISYQQLLGLLAQEAFEALPIYQKILIKILRVLKIHKHPNLGYGK